MNKLLKKEIKLSASKLSFLFIMFSFMFLLPGYPILCGVFFVTLGIFQSFQSSRETNDILFSVLLPIRKKDIVIGKYLFSCLIEIISLIIMGLLVIVRMTLLSDAPAYRENALMNANLFALGLAFVIFAIFNIVFIGGFFKTAYNFGKPFVSYIILSFLVLGVGEAIHHFPNMSFINAFGTEHLLFQLSSLIVGIIFYIITTVISCKKSCSRFEIIDL